MHITDALSRAYLKSTDVAQTEFCEAYARETVDHEEHIPVDPRNEMFPVSKLPQMLISKNLSVLSDKKVPSPPCCPIIL